MDGAEKVRRLIAEEREKKTGILNLGDLQLTEVPVEVLELSHLRVLNLGSKSEVSPQSDPVRVYFWSNAL